MEDIFNELYLTYSTLLNDLNIGYTLDNKKIEYLWSLIYKLYFAKYENYANKDVLKLLEYYEYK